AGAIVAVDVKEAALEAATGYGATHTVNPRHDDAVRRVQEITEGGADFAFEAYGSGATTKMAVDMVRKRGTAIIVGIAPLGDTADLEPVWITRMEKTIRGCYYGSSRPRRDMPRIVDWYTQGMIDIDGLI